MKKKLGRNKPVLSYEKPEKLLFLQCAPQLPMTSSIACLKKIFVLIQSYKPFHHP
jgi:hypothetical protein